MSPRRRARSAVALLAAAAALAAGSGLLVAPPASAADVVPADPAVGGTLYLANANDGTDYPVGAAIGWNDPVMALPSPGDLTNRLTAPTGAQSVVTFVGPQGREFDPSTWNATAPWDLTLPGQWMADVTPYHLIAPGSGAPSGTNATASVSGDYSLGVAYLKDGGLHVVPGGLYFVHIHLTGNPVPDKATYTWAPVQATGPAVAAQPAGAGDASAGLLSFVAPAVVAAAGGPVGTLVVAGGGARAANSGWTVVVSGSGAARTLATGSGAQSIDASGATSAASGRPTTGTQPTTPAAAGPTTITLTLVAG